MNARLEAELAEMELAPVQRKIEARSSDDSFTGLVRTLYFADTFLSDSELHHQTINIADLKKKRCTISKVFYKCSPFPVGSHNTPSLWAGTNGGCVFAYMLRIPPVEHRADEAVTAAQGKRGYFMLESDCSHLSPPAITFFLFLPYCS